MLYPNVFIKISSYFVTLTNKNIVDFVRNISKRNHLTIFPSAVWQTKQALDEKGIEHEFKNGIWTIKNRCGRIIAFQAAEKVQSEVQDKILAEEISATVQIPFMSLASVLTPLNGDDYARIACSSYDEVYVLTTIENLDKKIEELKLYPKIIVLGF